MWCSISESLVSGDLSESVRGDLSESGPAAVSFCIQTKTAASFSEVISCAFFGSSWSSDTALQVTCIVRRHMLSKFILFGCCHLFLPHSRLCFSFPTLSFLVSHP